MTVRLWAGALVLATGLLAFSGCDLFGSDPGSFGVTVEGAVRREFEGEPVSIINPFSRGEKSYQFRLAASGQNVSVTVATDGGRLAPGAYPVGRYGLDLAPGRAEATASLSRSADFFFSRAGTVTLTAVTPDRAQGSFEFAGVGGGREVAVRGSFDADLNANAVVTE